jgi:hypothetical protein
MTMALLASSPEVAMDRQHPYEHFYFAWMAEWSALADRTEWDMQRWDTGAFARLQLGDESSGLVGPPPWLPRQLWQAEDPGDELGPRLLAAAWSELSGRAAERTRRDLDRPDAQVRYHAEKALSVARLRQLSSLPLRALVVHRDPRDVWLSVQAFDRARGYYGFGRTPGESEAEWLERFLADQAARLRRALEERERADALLVSFAELVGRPAAAADRIGAWLELDLDPAAMELDLRRHRDHATSASPRASLDRWRRELEPELRDRFAAALGEELVELGYEP